jgi:nitrite reductase (NADH) small subunit
MYHWVLVGTLDSIPPRGARRLCTKAGPVAVFRTADDEVLALVDRCPHKGGPLSEGIVSGRTVACPLHNWVINLGTGRACEPDDGSTPSIPVKIEDGMIFAALVAEPA